METGGIKRNYPRPPPRCRLRLLANEREVMACELQRPDMPPAAGEADIPRKEGVMRLLCRRILRTGSNRGSGSVFGEPTAKLDSPGSPGTWRYAHHPPGIKFRDHVWLCRGYYLCKGCTIAFLGFLTAIVVESTSEWLRILPEEQSGVVLACLVMPTLVTALPRVSRPWKLSSRFLLGAALYTAIALFFITNRWSVRSAILITYLAIRIPLAAARRRRMLGQ